VSHLVILGDLFEFFFGFKNIPSKENLFLYEYLPVLERLQTLSHHGIHLKYFEGNHDFFLNSLFSEQFQMEVDVHPTVVRNGWGERKRSLPMGSVQSRNSGSIDFFEEC